MKRRAVSGWQVKIKIWWTWENRASSSAIARARSGSKLTNTSSMISGNKRARPGFFIFAHTFMHEYIEESFFKKEEFLFKALEDSGFPAEEGPIVAMRTEQAKSIESAEHMGNAAKGWQGGDEALLDLAVRLEPVLRNRA